MMFRSKAEELLHILRHLRAAIGGTVPERVEHIVRSGDEQEVGLWSRRIAVLGVRELDTIFMERLAQTEFLAALAQRFGELSDEVQDAVTWVDQDTLREWLPRIDTAQSAEDVVFRTAAQQLRREGRARALGKPED